MKLPKRFYYNFECEMGANVLRGFRKENFPEKLIHKGSKSNGVVVYFKLSVVSSVGCLIAPSDASSSSRMFKLVNVVINSGATCFRKQSMDSFRWVNTFLIRKVFMRAVNTLKPKSSREVLSVGSEIMFYVKRFNPTPYFFFCVWV